jgi:hypothetical protein
MRKPHRLGVPEGQRQCMTQYSTAQAHQRQRRRVLQFLTLVVLSQVCESVLEASNHDRHGQQLPSGTVSEIGVESQIRITPEVSCGAAVFRGSALTPRFHHHLMPRPSWLKELC